MQSFIASLFQYKRYTIVYAIDMPKFSLVRKMANKALTWTRKFSIPVWLILIYTEGKLTCKANGHDHYNDVIMSAMMSQITSLTIVYSSVYSDADQRKHQSSGSLVFVRGIHRWPENSPHKGPATRKMFPFDDVIMTCITGVTYHPFQFSGGYANGPYMYNFRQLSNLHYDIEVWGFLNYIVVVLLP